MTASNKLSPAIRPASVDALGQPAEGTRTAYEALTEALQSHLRRVQHLPVSEAIAVLSADYLARGDRAGVEDRVRHRVEQLMATVAPEEALRMMAWHLAEGEVGISPIRP
jgi:hypothetical protein